MMATKQAKTHTQHLDRGSHSLLAVCSCGWRQHATDAINGWTLAATHGVAAHGDGVNAHAALRHAKGRTRRHQRGSD